MSNDPYDRYSRANRLRSTYSHLFDGGYSQHDDEDELVQERRPRKKRKFTSFDLADENLDLLPARHREVIELLLKGFSIQYVAEDRGVSCATIEKIVKSAERRINDAKR